ncbi:hypothetical protein Tco_0856982 [Tanacetum coccineum]|uniref:Uncharacterized protein n=1 Tax=Tanacetum coccineum TaxID=301880 RepID=A0ABQ5B5B9_9ASTR
MSMNVWSWSTPISAFVTKGQYQSSPTLTQRVTQHYTGIQAPIESSMGALVALTLRALAKYRHHRMVTISRLDAIPKSRTCTSMSSAEAIKELCSDDDKESFPNGTFTTNVIVMIHSAKDKMDNQGKSRELEHWDKDFEWFNGDTPIRKEFDEFCERWWGKNGKNKEPKEEN